ncbi:hypothetical protein [Tsukamurella soli]|uniref:Uncharacterized protein n=1 Tax=Tsukamurella soli TaxID=644556 RepID=A0ABP8JIX2_9ACTN
MSATERVAGVLAEHQPIPGAFACSCPWRWPEEPTWACGEDERFVRDHAAHVAEQIASADGLAVVELVEPTRPGVWLRRGDMGGVASVGFIGADLVVSVNCMYSEEDAEWVAAAALSAVAARAAERAS